VILCDFCMKILLPIAAVALVAACSAPADPPAPETVTVTASPSAQAPVTSTAPVTVIAAPPTAPVNAPPGPCTDADLAVSHNDLENQGSEYRLLLHFTNTSARTCTLSGYPGADLVNATGPVVHVERRPGNATPHLTLQPGEAATADLQSSDTNPANGGMCPRWGSVVVIAPNTFQARDLGIGMPFCSALISSVT
jgi:hypothetical protein